MEASSAASTSSVSIFLLSFFRPGRLSNLATGEAGRHRGGEAIDLSFQKCVGDQCNSQGRDGVAFANCENFVQPSSTSARSGICLRNRSLLWRVFQMGLGGTPDVTAIRALRMQKDQLQVGHTSTQAIAGAKL